MEEEEEAYLERKENISQYNKCMWKVTEQGGRTDKKKKNLYDRPITALLRALAL